MNGRLRPPPETLAQTLVQGSLHRIDDEPSHGRNVHEPMAGRSAAQNETLVLGMPVDQERPVRRVGAPTQPRETERPLGQLGHRLP